MRPLSIFGSDPPERATVKRPFLSIESFWALTRKAERDTTRVSVSEKETRMGAFGGWWMVAILVAVLYLEVSSSQDLD